MFIGLGVLFQDMDVISFGILKIVVLLITLVTEGEGKHSRQKRYQSKEPWWHFDRLVQAVLIV